MDANDVIAIIGRRRAKFQAQRRSGAHERVDETARLIAEGYDALLAEIEVAIANRLEADHQNKKAQAEILGDQGQPGGWHERQTMSTPLDPRLPDPDPDPERFPPGPDPEPDEPEPEVLDPGAEQMTAWAALVQPWHAMFSETST
jgi:hypothetical protein